MHTYRYTYTMNDQTMLSIHAPVHMYSTYMHVYIHSTYIYTYYIGCMCVCTLVCIRYFTFQGCMYTYVKLTYITHACTYITYHPYMHEWSEM